MSTNQIKVNINKMKLLLASGFPALDYAVQPLWNEITLPLKFAALTDPALSLDIQMVSRASGMESVLSAYAGVPSTILFVQR